MECTITSTTNRPKVNTKQVNSLETTICRFIISSHLFVGGISCFVYILMEFHNCFGLTLSDTRVKFNYNIPKALSVLS